MRSGFAFSATVAMRATSPITLRPISARFASASLAESPYCTPQADGNAGTLRRGKDPECSYWIREAFRGSWSARRQIWRTSHMHDPHLPTAAEMLNFGSEHNPKVWSKHRSHLTDPSRPDAVLKMCQPRSGKLSRQHVFDIAGRDSALGQKPLECLLQLDRGLEAQRVFPLVVIHRPNVPSLRARLGQRRRNWREIRNSADRKKANRAIPQ
jgi:hypothetical protein